MTTYNLDILLSQFWTSSLFHVWFLTCVQVLRKQVRWSGIPISSRIFHSLLWSTVKGFSVVNEAEIDVFLELPSFFYDPTDVAIWSLVPLPFLNPAWTSSSSRFTYFWNLVWRILSITLLVCEMSANVW